MSVVRSCAVLLVLGLVGAAAQPAWTGRMQCEALDERQGALNVAIDITVEGNLVRYTRAVRDPRTGGVRGTAESGSGTLQPDGRLVLTGGASDQGFSYTATYSGRIGPDGRGTLVGAQQWTRRGSSAVNRACTVTIRRG